MPAAKYRTSGFRRKPKSERVPPVKAWDHFSMTKEEAKLKQIIEQSCEVVYGHRISIFAKPGKSATLLIQRYVVRRSKTPLRLTHPLPNMKNFDLFRDQIYVPYTKAETVAVRTFYLTSKGNVGYYFYDLNYSSTGEVMRTPISPLHPNTMPTLVYGRQNLPKDFWTLNQWRGFLTLAANTLGKPIDTTTNYPMIQYVYPEMRAVWGNKSLRCDNAAAFTQELFGKRHTRRDLVRAVGKTLSLKSISISERSARLFWATCFKGLVPTDWIVGMLNTPRPLHISSEFLTAEYDRTTSDLQHRKRAMRIALEALNMHERKALLKNAMRGHDFNELVDIGRQLGTPVMTTNNNRPVLIPVPEHRNFKTVHEYHDVYFAEIRRLQRLYREARDAEMIRFPNERAIGWNEPTEMFINYHPEADVIAQKIAAANVGIDGAEIVFARDREMLEGWGDYMHNCISSYFGQKVLLGGFYMGGELIANFELRAIEGKKAIPGRVLDLAYRTQSEEITNIPFKTHANIEGFELRQLLGKYNQSLDDATKEHIKLLLSGYGVEISTNVWA